jgi:ferritin-like metal-binding protein YciE
MATKKSRARSKQRAQPKRQSLGARELLVVELQGIHNAEQQLARVTPRFIKAAEAEMLRAYLHRRLETGSQLIEELTQAFEELDRDPGRKKNVAAEGLLDDLRAHIQEIAAGPARDAVLIAGAQKIEHYCVAAWGTARALAQALGIQSVNESMSRALDEGKDLDRQLTELAEGEILPELLADEDAKEVLEEDADEEEQTLGRSRRTPGSERRAH